MRNLMLVITKNIYNKVKMKRLTEEAQQTIDD